jgi:hypothetical protein
VEAWLARRVTKHDVVSQLGPDFTWHEPGDYTSLTEFLSREPVEQYKPVRAAASEGRRMMFYTTMCQQTWLFFDDSDVLVGYWFNTQ